MDLCGSVYVSKDLLSFSLKCSNCDDIITKWTEFQKHVKNCLLSKVAEFIELVEDELPVEEFPIDTESKFGVMETSVIIEPAFLANVNIKEEDDDLPLSFLHSKAERRNSAGKSTHLSEHDIDESKQSTDDVQDEDFKYEPDGIEELDENTFSDQEWSEHKSDSDSCEDNSSEDYVPKSTRRKVESKDDKKFIVSFFRKHQTTGFFIDLYKQHPCLWDSKDENYTNKAAHSEAYRDMIESIRKKYKVELTERKIVELIDKIRQQYYETRQLYTTNPKSNLLKSLAIMHYKRCIFLGEIEVQQMEKEQTIKLKRSVKDNSFNSKFKIFSRCEKQYIDAFIKIYECYPELYDRNHVNHQNNMLRREIHLKMIEELNTNYGGNGVGGSLTLDELITYISSLRHWYYSISKKIKNPQQQLTDDEKSYYEKCQFLPEYIKQTTVSCEHCSSTFKSMVNYQKHVFEAHQIGEPYQYKCEYCSRDFPKQTSLTLHIQRHHSGKNFACEFCDRRFSIKADWRLHLRVHTNEKPYICDQCGKAFRLRNQLGNHVTTMHLRERAFQCTMCPKAFYKKVHLTDHIKSHLNIRDKICKTCGKGFTNSHSLGRHRQIHSEIKKFACKLCDARFHQFVGLNSHMKRTHGIFKAKPKDEFIVSFFRKDQTTAFFIDIYQQHPCLWDPQDENFTSKRAHSAARQAMIESIRKKYRIELSEQKINGTIDKIRQQYYETRQLYTTNPKSNQLKELAIMHYKRCLFLGEIEVQKMEKEQTIKLRRSVKDSSFNSKFKIFNRCDKEYVDAFIEIYERYPELYDRNHINHQNNMLRREIHLQMIEELNANHGGNGDGEDLTLEELTTYISSLRHWYYGIHKKSKNPDQPLTDEERAYFEKCQFMPDYVKQMTISCEHCSSIFKSEAMYQIHVYEVHQIGEPYQYKCEHCNREFPKQTSLSLHIQRHHTEKNFVCDFCDRRFSIKADWKLHLRVHTNEKPYICDQCGKAFRLRNQLGNHVTTMHLRERAFKCSMCPKAFYLKVHLTDHIKSHLNIRDKICKTCGKGFTNTHSLRRHMQIHSEIKKFACKLCDARFHQFVGLNSHMKRTHGIFKAKPKDE